VSAGFTPGPWTWDRGDDGDGRLRGPAGAFVLYARGYDGADVIVSDADARLIAAAPEMRAELERCLGFLRDLEEGDGDPDPTVHIFRRKKSIRAILRRLDGDEGGDA
jgi:hypothetical protein